MSSASPPTSHLRANRLARETSPYLLQHKHNPVDWWPWGPEALAEAQRTGKPILLSVGYAACHWCHVMAHESFEDDATAAVMNELFVNIKVDREERPDIDQIYMSALHHLGEQGGWPLTMFLTPQGEPVWGGTYFPKESRYGRAAFVDVLQQLARVFREKPEQVEQNRTALMERIANVARPQGQTTFAVSDLDTIARRVLGLIDPTHGGIRGAPKFPQASVFENLWRAGLRTARASIPPPQGEGGRREAAAGWGATDPHPSSRSEGSREATLPVPGRVETNSFFDAVLLTLDRICEGGIYDHLGGGFARYSVDERWLVPHFEKMLYDNAQLLDLLALAYTQTGKPLYAERARETVAWLGREMTTQGGAFSASLDADSEGEEGKFYVWGRNEIDELLGPEAGAFFARHYDVSHDGNFEGHNILNRLETPERGAEDETRLAQLREILFEARTGRIRPGLDDKVLADWNGLMIAALVNGGIAFRERGWIDMAARAFDFIATTMTRDDRLGHSWRDGRLLFPGLASDHADMTRAALALHEARADARYLGLARAWQQTLEQHYANADGSYFLTADDAEGLVVRPASTLDEALPNHNAIIAQNLVRLAVLAGDDAYRARADKLFDALLPVAAENLFGHLALINALDLRLSGAEIVVTGDGDAADALTEAALRLPSVSRIVLRAPRPAVLPASHPAAGKLPPLGGAAAYVCRGETCSLPITDAGLLTLLPRSGGEGGRA